MEAQHRDAIMDCATNFHGTRLATCAADRRIIVWDQEAEAEGGGWSVAGEPLEKHSSAVHKVDWAHPEFGQVLASCSADRTVIVWEETQNRCDTLSPQKAHPTPPAPPRPSQEPQEAVGGAGDAFG